MIWIKIFWQEHKFEYFSTKVIPQRVFPSRPYLSARISGQESRKFAWRGKTPHLWKAHSFLPSDQPEFTWSAINMNPENEGFNESKYNNRYKCGKPIQ